MDRLEIHVTGLCDGCEGLIEDTLVTLEGIYGVYMDGGKLIVEYDPSKASPAEIVRTVLDTGVEVTLTHLTYRVLTKSDPRTIMRMVREVSETDRAVVAMEYEPYTQKIHVLIAPVAGPDHVKAILEARGISVALEAEGKYPARKSYG